LSATVAGACSLWGPTALHAAATRPQASVVDEIGLTTGSLIRHLAAEPADGKLRLLDLPRLLRDELDMRVIDLMTATLPSLEPAYLDELRTAAENAGCVLTNLKMNQPDYDLAASDDEVRRRSLAGYKASIDAALRLGCRWVRPLPKSNRPDLLLVVDGYRELIEYAAPYGITLLVENFGWIGSDAEAIPRLIEAVGPGLSACPDTGNWNDDVRYTGLERAFPQAVTCDFKFLALDAQGVHAKYDLERCFQIGWQAGFRGPWCFEHQHADLPTLLADLKLLRDRLRGWINAAKSQAVDA
jgi:hypothetical protein